MAGGVTRTLLSVRCSLQNPRSTRFYEPLSPPQLQISTFANFDILSSVDTGIYLNVILLQAQSCERRIIDLSTRRQSISRLKGENSLLRCRSELAVRLDTASNARQSLRCSSCQKLLNKPNINSCFDQQGLFPLFPLRFYRRQLVNHGSDAVLGSFFVTTEEGCAARPVPRSGINGR